VILMDEPFGALDAQTRMQLQEDLLRLWELGRKTIIFVTHDIGEAIALGDRTLVLSRAPARVAGEHLITIPRPRDIRGIMGHPDFSGLYQAIRAEVQ
jgi:NitT/TauT family transport system ATP-binding protein